ncbi:MAG: FHA domain-containing protein [Acetatifactor sp.]|nr:FHA domain-containing protein [Acetatifactor sp.]
MNSENFTLQNSLEANYLNIRLDFGERPDEIAVKVIRKDCPEFLIPFRIVSVNEETVLKYKLINTVALEYAEMTLPKALFVQLYLNLLEPFVKGRDWFLDYHNFCVDTRYVYVDKHTYQVFYLYVPVPSYRSEDREILEFFKNVFMRIMISDDKDFQVRLFRFFGDGHITLAGLYRLMLEEKGAAASSQATFLQPASQQPVNQQPAYRQPVSQQPAYQQSVSQQPAFQQPASRQTPFSQSVMPVEEKKKDSDDGRKKDKKQMSYKASEPEQERNLGYGADNSEDEVVQALFGNKKGKKEKPSAESKRAEKEPGRKTKEEKGHGGLGSLFGGRKKQTVPPSQTPEHGVAAGGQPAYAGVRQTASTDYAPGAADYASVYGGNGSDETEVFSDEAAAVQTPWMELIDFSQPGALQRIDLNFTKPYITIGRMSSDEKRPDVAFPGEFKRIGRQHARIERRGDAFFVIDLGSANHTMVNGQVMVPNQPYQLQDGMELAFTVSKPVRYRVHIS